MLISLSHPSTRDLGRGMETQDNGFLLVIDGVRKEKERLTAANLLRVILFLSLVHQVMLVCPYLHIINPSSQYHPAFTCRFVINLPFTWYILEALFLIFPISLLIPLLLVLFPKISTALLFILHFILLMFLSSINLPRSLCLPPHHWPDHFQTSL